ncbi:MAG: response regulator transcription factor [Bacteroidota bacterium]
MSKILVIEDEPVMQRGLKDNLEYEGYEVDLAGDGKAGLQKLLANSYDLALLDVMLPLISGYDVCRTAREKGVRTPIIMLTSKGEEIDKVLGLELGADDYVTKPFSLRELLARVKAVLRRHHRGSASGVVVLFGDVEIHFNTYNATRDGAELTMTPKEFDVLKFLWEHRNQTVTRDQLLTNVWGYDDSVSTRTVDNFIVRLRQKLEDDPAHPRHILTIHGAGYKLVV